MSKKGVKRLSAKAERRKLNKILEERRLREAEQKKKQQEQELAMRRMAALRLKYLLKSIRFDTHDNLKWLLEVSRYAPKVSERSLPESPTEYSLSSSEYRELAKEFQSVFFKVKNGSNKDLGGMLNGYSSSFKDAKLRKRLTQIVAYIESRHRVRHESQTSTQERRNWCLVCQSTASKEQGKQCRQCRCKICQRCGTCSTSCPENAIRPKETYPAWKESKVGLVPEDEWREKARRHKEFLGRFHDFSS